MKRPAVKRVLLALFCTFSLINTFAQVEEKPYCSHLKTSGRLTRNHTRLASTDSYDVKHYHVDIQVDNSSAYIFANSAMTAEVVATQISQVELDLSSLLTVDSVFINGTKVAFTRPTDVVSATLPNPISDGGMFTITVYYRGNGSTPGFFSGISNAAAFTGQKYTWTLSEPLNALDWFPCKQVLEDKADSASVHITVPSDLKAGSNGVLMNVVNLPDSKTRYEWETHYPIAYYLISFSAGPYDEYISTVTVNDKQMPIQTYVYAGLLSSYQSQLDQVGAMITLYSQLYGDYPFVDEKYGHCQAPIGGGMEHQTMSTMDNFGFSLAAHELAHQWFGDQVTCGSWQDIWVNEGFARYSEYISYENFYSKEVADNVMGGYHENVMSNAAGSVYVPQAFATTESRIFSLRLTYNKGAAIIHMIRNIINDDDVFFGALRTYQSTFKHTVATGESFKGVFEAASGKDFDDFFNEWYYGEGFPSYRIYWNYDSDSLYVRQQQTTSSTITPFFHLPIDYRVQFDDGSSEDIRLTASTKDEIMSTYTGKTVTGITVNPGKWALMKLTSLSHDTKLKYNPVTGISGEQAEAFSIYPNPASTSISILPADNRKFSYGLMNLQGAEVQKITGLQGERTIDTSSLPNGLYILRITGETTSVIKKIQILR
jgi:aminopeptidase N